jgi:hypothetical protein
MTTSGLILGPALTILFSILAAFGIVTAVLWLILPFLLLSRLSRIVKATEEVADHLRLIEHVQAKQERQQNANAEFAHEFPREDA